MDKVQKIREEVEKLKSQLIRGACSAQIAMETMCKEEAYDEVLSIIDSMQEKPKKCMHSKDDYIKEDRKVLCDGCKEDCKFNKKEEPVSNVWHYQKKEPVDEIADKSRPIIVVYGNNSLNATGKFRYYEDNSDAIWLSNSYEKWAFVEDLINLTHSVTKVSWQEEPVSEELEAFIKERVKNIPIVLRSGFHELCRQLILDGAKWQQEKEYTCYEEAFEDGAKWKVENLWKPADGDDLPEIDREVIALTQPYPNDEHLRVVFAHRPNKYAKFWNSTLGEEQVVEIEGYDKGGWNIPDVKFWLDVELLKEIEL